MFDKRIRERVATISNKCTAAHNKYMSDKYDPRFLFKYITYLYNNNLYDWVLSKPLPTHGFKWKST